MSFAARPARSASACRVATEAIEYSPSTERCGLPVPLATILDWSRQRRYLIRALLVIYTGICCGRRCAHVAEGHAPFAGRCASFHCFSLATVVLISTRRRNNHGLLVVLHSAEILIDSLSLFVATPSITSTRLSAPLGGRIALGISPITAPTIPRIELSVESPTSGGTMCQFSTTISSSSALWIRRNSGLLPGGPCFAWMAKIGRSRTRRS